ncbi:hypothetical protein MNV_1270006 [Candidatus Methanoperedens nitroreducens]|uniref:Uncharacterized protein n=2 Tax=Candidatus Methanoperedens nitratireducens TaxID=1392998 RepID=A0A284VK59_9EURY|nr:hypothetical protein MNV_1270006 [Candidatus Methanoperedens nitroreducens]
MIIYYRLKGLDYRIHFDEQKKKYFGLRDHTAILYFQNKHNLDVIGIIDGATISRLHELSKKRKQMKVSGRIATNTDILAKSLRIITIGKRLGKDFDKSRYELRWLDCEINEESPSNEFAKNLEVSVILKIHSIMEKNKKAHDSWLNTGWKKSALELAGLIAAAASATISLAFRVMPLFPVAVATGVLGLFDSSIPLGAELAFDWNEGKQEAMGNGSHYLLKITGR